MRKLFTSAAIVVGFMAGTVHAQNATKEQAVELVKKAASAVKTEGKDSVIKEVNAKSDKWHKGELYLIVLGPDGTHLAHPTNPKLLGKSMLDVPDEEGKLFRKERVDIAASKGEGWVDYKYKNPQSGALEQKTLYVLKQDDVILSAGTYK